MAEALRLNIAELREEVENINRLANEVDKAVKTLQEEINKCVAAGIQTEWGIRLKDQLTGFNSNDMVDAINEIKLQAAKLTASEELTVKMSQGQQ